MNQLHEPTRPPPQPQSRDDFEIALICALPVECDAVEAVMDGYGEGPYSYSKARGDTNAYTTGWIGSCNVVLAYMPGMGGKTAAAVAANLGSSFPNIKLGLVVGVCGGVPQIAENKNLFLGDVTISTAIIDYTFGRQFTDNFVRRDTLEDNLGRPNSEIRAFLVKLKGLRTRQLLNSQAWSHLEKLQTQPELRANYPGTQEDKLFSPSYQHKHQKIDSCSICAAWKKKDDPVCDKSRELSCGELGCSNDEFVTRQKRIQPDETALENQSTVRIDPRPTVFFGRIASGESVMKSGHHRDQIASKEQVIAFEMEGAGVWDSFPTIVIKGVCDYADSHKNKKWQKYAAATAAAYMKALLGQWGASDTAPRKSKHLNTVPKNLVSNFIGRHEILHKIENSLFGAPEDDMRPQVLVLQAMGGQGKTQVALQACRRAKNTHPGIFWIDATSQTTVESGFESLAEKLNTSGRLLDGIKAKVDFVLDHLQSWDQRWLLVLDNYDQPEIFKNLRDFMPYSRNGTLILTSRNEGAGRLGELLQVPSMVSDNGEAILLRQYWKRSGTLGERQEAALIVERLGGLALTLDQAASYINFTRVTFSQFLSRYESKRKQVMTYRPELFEYHNDAEEPVTVFTTWELLFDQVATKDAERKRHIENFLTVSSWLDPRNITGNIFRAHQQISEETFDWQQMFKRQDNEESSSESEIDKIANTHARNLQKSQPSSSKRWSSTCFQSTVSRLKQVGLLQDSIFGTEASKSFSIHPVVRDWLHKRGPDSEYQKEAASQCLRILTAAVNSASTLSSSPTTRKLLVNHLDAWILASQSIKLSPTLGSSDLRQNSLTVSAFFRTEGYYSKSVAVLETLVAEDEQNLFLEGATRLASMNDLAISYMKEGRWEKAELLNMKIVDISKQVLGEEHPDTLSYVANLASIYWNQGRWKEAKTLDMRVIKMTKQAIGGGEHVNLLNSVANLASTYKSQGQLDKAEMLNMQILETSKRVLGEEHPETLASMNNLASTYWKQERWEDAETLGLQVMEISKRVLGEQHPDTLSIIANLASTYWNQGRLKEAERLETQVMETRMRVLGEEHPNTLSSMDNLAATYSNQGRWKEAETLGVQVMKTSQKVLGEEHPDTLISMTNLASTYSNQERWTEAEILEVQVIKIRKQVLGQEHPLTATSMLNLAFTLKSLGRTKEALQNAKSVFLLRRKVLGKDHLDTKASFNILAEWSKLYGID